MKEILHSLNSYIRGNIIVLIAGILSLCTFAAVLFLYAIPLEPVTYAALLSVFISLTVGTISFVRFHRHHVMLNCLKNSINLSVHVFPSSKNLIECDYQELINEVERNRLEIINEKNKSYSDMVDYYTIWAHQIKTPIAAMRLILQSENSETNTELLEQLFKTEQYVEMVLQYLRLESLNSDLKLDKYSLDKIIKQAVRKYSSLFIRKKIKLNYDSVDLNILTDEKWLVFVIEQILSNSLKYTNTGEISIYLEDYFSETLVIEDTGIGIEQEDLPRVFEKGFTGYNGRLDKKSTGIGLYLCKNILNKLSHTIKIESEVEKGTKVKIGFQMNKINFE